jgi:hypothetical protein
MNVFVFSNSLSKELAYHRLDPFLEDIQLQLELQPDFQNPENHPLACHLSNTFS